jgi:hypothetical protein
VKATPEIITRLDSNQVFVFGSNEAGIHGGGAARLASEKYGARWHQGEGLMGQSYGIPTKDRHLHTLPIEKIKAGVDRFLRLATKRPELEFFVTKIGCGLAGYSTREIRECFVGKSIPSNVVLPIEFQS